jgi:hypothetical protein
MPHFPAAVTFDAVPCMLTHMQVPPLLAQRLSLHPSATASPGAQGAEDAEDLDSAVSEEDMREARKRYR